MAHDFVLEIDSFLFVEKKVGTLFSKKKKVPDQTSGDQMVRVYFLTRPNRTVVRRQTQDRCPQVAHDFVLKIGAF